MTSSTPEHTKPTCPPPGIARCTHSKTKKGKAEVDGDFLGTNAKKKKVCKKKKKKKKKYLTMVWPRTNRNKGGGKKTNTSLKGLRRNAVGTI